MAPAPARLTRDQAAAIATEYLAPRDSLDMPVRLTEDALESEFYWVFFYNTVESLDTGNPLLGLAGNGPIVVAKWSGRIGRLGTATAPETQLTELEAARAGAAPASVIDRVFPFDLTEWASRSGMTPTALDDGDLMAFTDMELVFFLAERKGGFVVEKVDRGGPRRNLGAFSAREDATRFLVYWLGIGVPGHASPSDPALSDVTLEQGPTATHMSWTGGSAQFPLGLSGEIAAAQFNWARTRTYNEIARTFDPTWI